MALSADLWRNLAPHMDEVLDLSPEQREARLAELARTNPPLAQALEALLAEHDAASREEFLDGPAAAEVRGLGCTDLTGARFGNYVLQSLVGQGGMGSVWLARRDDGSFEGHAAVKVINAGVLSAAAAQRFKQEGTILARLSHRGIARLLDAGVSVGGLPYLVLEYVDGRPIDVHCDSLQLGTRWRVELFLDVLAAVEHSHTHLIVHRDIKPSNVLVSQQGEVKLLDFGIAKLLENEHLSTEHSAATTVHGSRAMTPQFAAPEQLLGQAVTTATDVYSLGVLLYGLLTGAHPTGLAHAPQSDFIQAVLQGEGVRASAAVSARSRSREELARIAQERGTTPQRLRRQLSGDLDNILAKALKRDPRERYRSVSALAEDLRRFLHHEAVSARSDSLGYRAVRFVRRNRAACAGAALTLMVLVTGLATTMWQARVAATQAQRTAAVHAFVLDLFGANERERMRAVQADDTKARELLDMAAQRVDDLPDTSLQARIDLLGTLASMYAGLGLDADATGILERELALVRQAAAQSLGGNPAAVADALIRVATSAQLAGAVDKREAAYGEAQRLLQAMGDTDSDRYARLQVVEYHRQATRDQPAAAAAADRALAVFRRLGDQRQVVRTLRLRGQAHARMGQFAPAEQAVAEAFDLLQRTEPTNHVLASSLLAVRGEIQLYLNKVAASVQSFTEAVAASVRGRGDNHPATGFLRVQFSHALCLNGNLVEGERQARLAVQVLEQTLGPDDPWRLATAMDALAQAQMDRGLFEEGMHGIRRSLALHARVSPGGLYVAFMHLSLAQALVETGQFAQARQEMEHARAALKGDSDPRLPASAALVEASLALAEDRPQQARAALQQLADGTMQPSAQFLFNVEEALAQARVALANNEPDVADRLAAARRQLAAGDLLSQAPLMEARLLLLEGQALLQRQQPSAAVAPLRRALALREARMHDGSPRLSETRVWLARALAGSGERGAARALLDQVRAHAGGMAPQYQRELQAALAALAGPGRDGS